MSRRKPGPTPNLLLQIMAALGEGHITETWIADPGMVTEGLCQTSGARHITINPQHQVVDLVLHECAHRLHPEWSERYIRNRVGWLRRRMTDEQIQTVYAEYERRRYRRKSVRRADDP